MDETKHRSAAKQVAEAHRRAHESLAADLGFALKGHDAAIQEVIRATKQDVEERLTRSENEHARRVDSKVKAAREDIKRLTTQRAEAEEAARTALRAEFRGMLNEAVAEARAEWLEAAATAARGAVEGIDARLRQLEK